MNESQRRAESARSAAQDAARADSFERVRSSGFLLGTPGRHRDLVGRAIGIRGPLSGLP